MSNDTVTERKLTFYAPDVYFENENGHIEKNEDKSEMCILLEALEFRNKPARRVYYAAKMNKYFKDPEFENPFTDSEIQALNLPIPAELNNERQKLIKKYTESGRLPNMRDIYLKTMPMVLLPTENIKQRLNEKDPVTAIIDRINTTSS